MSLIWNGKEIRTMGDTLDAFVKCESQEEIQKLMDLYRADSQHADANIGYMLGYLSEAEARRIRSWLGPKVSHPIFGDIYAPGGKLPTAEEALEAGRKLGEASKS